MNESIVNALLSPPALQSAESAARCALEGVPYAGWVCGVGRAVKGGIAALSGLSGYDVLTTVLGVSAVIVVARFVFKRVSG